MKFAFHSWQPNDPIGTSRHNRKIINYIKLSNAQSKNSTSAPHRHDIEIASVAGHMPYAESLFALGRYSKVLLIYAWGT